MTPFCPHCRRPEVECARTPACEEHRSVVIRAYDAASGFPETPPPRLNRRARRAGAFRR